MSTETMFLVIRTTIIGNQDHDEPQGIFTTLEDANNICIFENEALEDANIFDVFYWAYEIPVGQLWSDILEEVG